MMSPLPARLARFSDKVARFFLDTAKKLGQVAATLLVYVWTTLLNIWKRILGQPASRKSLRLRLSVFFSLFMLMAWLTAAFFAWHTCRDYIDEFFDSQQMAMAGTLSVADVTRAPDSLPSVKDMLPGVDKHNFGELESEAIAFAIFSPDGRPLLTDGKKGRRFLFEPSRRGFINEALQDNDDLWRILWMDSHDGRYVIAVGQELEYRQDMALEMLEGQLLPWLILIPVLLAGLFILLTRELAPLHAMAQHLRNRTPEDTTPLNLHRLPSEVLPMAESLNGFFLRTRDMLIRERSFISDAAHELRTPLAGLRVQAQVAAQPCLDQDSRLEALSFLRQGIDRCSRLIDQLLALSRLEDSYTKTSPLIKKFSPVNWASLLENFLPEYKTRLASSSIRFESHLSTLEATVQGNPTLISMLLRNVLENAAAYTPEKGLIRLTLEPHRLVVQNDSECLPEEQLSRLGERFFRPPGQTKNGSGLGLSIIGRIASIHGFQLAIEQENNTPGFSPCSFKVSVVW